MHIPQHLGTRFHPAVLHVNQSRKALHASGSALVVIQGDTIVAEHYAGRHAQALQSRVIQADSQFLVASVRKGYIGFAAAYAIYHGFIRSIDDPVTAYLPELDSEPLYGTTIRHLLTHTHGLKGDLAAIRRGFAPGTGWEYRDIGVTLLALIIRKATGRTIADIVTEQVLEPFHLQETGWYTGMHDKLVGVLRDKDDPNWSASERTDGDEMNLYVSARDLACWGYIHLKKGRIGGHQAVPQQILDMATSLQSPALADRDAPQNGFFWFVQDLPAKRTEIGALVPKGSYQLLGYTGAAVLVIPQHEIVAVRMLNRFGSPPGYDYLKDIRTFGDSVMRCL